MIVLGPWGFLILGIVELVVGVVFARRYLRNIITKTKRDCFDK